MHFTFYHELGHLIQKSDLFIHKLYEKISDEHEYSLKKHVLEFDADEFSAISMAAHISQYATVTFGNELTENDFETLLVIMCSSIFFYLVSFGTFKENIYYEEGSHPHPILRITKITFIIIKHSQSTLNQNGIQMNLNTTELTNKIMDFSFAISNKIITSEHNMVSLFHEHMKKEVKGISDHLVYINEMMHGDKNLAIYKWNMNVKSIHRK